MRPLPRILALLAATAALLAAFGGVGLPPATAAGAYAVTELPTLGGDTSAALALNNAGQVVGGAETAAGAMHAVLWDRGTLTDLGTLGGATSQTSGINNRGQVAGDALTAGGEQHIFLWAAGRLTDLGTLGGPLARGLRINDAGQVVGFSTTAPGQELNDPKARAFLYRDGAMRDLGTLPGGGGSRANGINDAGQATGAAADAGGVVRPVVWDGGRLVALGTLPGYPAGFGIRINAAGQVCGWLTTAGAPLFGVAPDLPLRAFFSSGGQVVDLGTLGGKNSQAYGLNDAGQVTGTAQLADGSAHAFLWERGVLTDLNALLPAGSGWVLQQAAAINAAGQIAGMGTLNGQQRGFLLTPVAMPGLPNTGGGSSQTHPPLPIWTLGAAGLVATFTAIAFRAALRRRRGG
jgi:probable HAF family extracellular repeat protein